MTVTRVGFASIPDATLQEQAIKIFNDSKNTRLKDGKPYIIESRATKCRSIRDTTGADNWNVIAWFTFASQADAEYYQYDDPVSKEMIRQGDSEGIGFIAVLAEFGN
ncbi:hypothetical protein F4801DRAFT_571967 [Xylaria longipes]|nr:hypothetical protein F4801DRAFT_571967 [Xylaria longipes]RYC62066.1 hypothetical protein CHU98_g4153 [Xylaria longipes]